MAEIGVQIRKVVMFSVKGCYRSICNHPFLVGMLCLLIFLYRSFPFMFSILVSASPVLVCTAVLLGTLLSFGQPNIPEIEKEERTTHEIVSLKTGFSGDNVVVERNENVSVERYNDKEKDVVEKSIEETLSVTNEISRVGSDSELVEETSREMQFDDRVKEEAQRVLEDFDYEQKSEMFEERIGDRRRAENQYSLITEVDDEHLDLENDKSPVGSVDSKVVNVDSLDSPPGSPWKHVNEGEGEEEEEEEEDDEASDSGSDRAESSSPDASMADIIPMLDELHPLLDEDTPQPANLSHDGSDAASERSVRSDESSNESDADTENQEELEVAEDDNEDGDDGEETHGEKEDQTKSAITWTEEDQKNLMDLGTSELERNQRLENLIARRRARKTMRMMTEKNLIDLDSADLPFNVPPISTARNNPFDLPHDSYENMGLPPIPGSAPSILLPRRNPFDIPYDSSEEKPDLMEDSFQQEFMPFQSKEPFFRRHESFNVRPSFFGINRPERQDVSRFRPYFVPERLGSEGTSYSPFERQSSELSESKVSSVPETESIGSADDMEERNVTEEEISETEVRNDAEEEITQDPQLISKIEHASELIGHGSESSEEEGSLEFGQVDKKHIVDEIEMKLGDEENRHETEPSMVTDESFATQLHSSSIETNSNAEIVERSYEGVSSSSSLSEESERIYVEKEADELHHFDEGRDNIEQPSILTQPSVQGSDLHITTGLTDDTSHKEPVYDSSPPAVRKNLSSSSISSDLQVESESGLPPVVVKRTVSFAERVTEVRSQDESDTPVDKEMLAGSEDNSEVASRGDVVITDHDVIQDNREILAGSSSVHSLNENEMISRGDVEVSAHDDLKYHSSVDDKIADSATEPVVPEIILVNTSGDANSSTDTSPKGNLMYEDVTSQHVRSVNADAHVAVCDAEQSASRPSDEQNLALSKEEESSAYVEHLTSVQMDSLSSRIQLTEHHISQGEALVADELVLSNSPSSHHEADESLTSTNHQYPPESLSDEESALSEKSVYQPLMDHKEAPEPSVAGVESVQEEITTDNWKYSGVQDFGNEVSPHSDITTSPESITVPSEMSEFRAPAVEETDEIKEIDEELLSELDTVGDFHVEEFKKPDDHVEFGNWNLAQKHDAKNFIGLEGNSTQALEAEHVVHTEDLGETIKESDKHDEDLMSVSEHEVSGTTSSEQIDSIQYDEKEIHDPSHIKSTEQTPNLEGKEADVAEDILKQNLEAEETASVMPEIEARSVNDIEAIFHKAEFTSVETEAVHIDSGSSFVDPSLGKTTDGTSEGRALDKASCHSEVPVETPSFEEKSVKDFDLDLNKVPEDNVEVISESGSIPQPLLGSEDKEGTSSEHHTTGTQSPDDSNSALKQISKSSPRKALKSTEDGEDIPSKVDLSKDVELVSDESDTKETTQNAPAPENADNEVKRPEDQDVATSDANSKKEKTSKTSSSSSSSSSSDSSSSDSN